MTGMVGERICPNDGGVDKNDQAGIDIVRDSYEEEEDMVATCTQQEIILWKEYGNIM